MPVCSMVCVCDSPTYIYFNAPVYKCKKCNKPPGTWLAGARSSFHIQQLQAKNVEKALLKGFDVFNGPSPLFAALKNTEATMKEIFTKFPIKMKY